MFSVSVTQELIGFPEGFPQHGAAVNVIDCIAAIDSIY